jgi:hypothetical protein
MPGKKGQTPMAQSFEDYWARLIAANPALGDPKLETIKLNPQVFRRELKKAFMAGQGKMGELLEKMLGTGSKRT